MLVFTRTTPTLLACLAAAFAAVCAIAPAAEGAWKVKGRGFGHGVGMSQYGAYGFALQGRGYEQILGHYYRGTNVGRLEGTGSAASGGAGVGRRRGGGSVRVLLDSGKDSVSFSGARQACGRNLQSAGTYSFATAGDGVELRSPGNGKLAGCGNEGKAKGKIVRIDGQRGYRGSLVAHANGTGLLVINQVPLEGYVKGVVPNEVPTSWPQQALRAQAVAARSYGIATERSGPFDHYADTRSQVYGGVESETGATNQAVEQTAGEVVKYGGETAITYFFSTSGGQTENSEFGFSGGNSIPYLKSVKDPYDDQSPVHRWRERFSDQQMESELTGLFSGKLKRIQILKTGRSPRIVRARVVGSKGSNVVTGDTLRARLELRSTWARFRRR